MELTAATAEHTQLSSQLESQTLTITNLNISLQTETNKVKSLENSMLIQQQHLQQAISSPSLLRHSPLKHKGGSSVKKKVEEYETNLLNMTSTITSTPSTREYSAPPSLSLSSFPFIPCFFLCFQPLPCVSLFNCALNYLFSISTCSDDVIIYNISVHPFIYCAWYGMAWYGMSWCGMV